MRRQMCVGAAVAAVAIAALAAVTAGAVAADRLPGRTVHDGVLAAAPAGLATPQSVAPPLPTAPSSADERSSPPPRPTSRSAPATPRTTPVARAASWSASAVQHRADAAVGYATDHGYHVAVAVLDTRTGHLVTAGDAGASYASESVVKTFIAARLLAAGLMTGRVADTAWRMITQSDDASANALYGLAGGDTVVTWAASHYGIPDVGSPPPRAGWWGGTRVTAAGLVRFYAAVKRDPSVGPWLFGAMHHAAARGTDGFNQLFGLASATTGAAVKQGWGFDFGDGSACLNSTGLVDGDRYAVAVLMRGQASSYPAAISAMQTQTARTLMLS